MLKFLSPLIAPGRCVIGRSALLTQQPMKMYSQTTDSGAATGVQEASPVSSESNDGEHDKLYSKVEIELRGSDPAVMKSYAWFATTAASHLGIEVGKCWDARKPQHDRLTLLKSAFVHKKHRVQYEVRTYFRFMHFHRLTGSTLSTFLEYIERNLPEGVALKATKIEILPLPEYLSKPPTLDNADK